MSRRESENYFIRLNQGGKMQTTASANQQKKGSWYTTEAKTSERSCEKNGGAKKHPAFLKLKGVISH